jgi:hypothetical protein
MDAFVSDKNAELGMPVTVAVSALRSARTLALLTTITLTLVLLVPT